MKTTVYKSNISTSLVIPLFIITGGVTLLMTYEKNWIGLLFMLILIAFIIQMFLTTYYTVTDKDLRVKCGFLYNTSIAINSIKQITETNNPISSPATSLDRLEILYHQRDGIIISPANKLAFMQHLKDINPEIELKLKPQTAAAFRHTATKF